MSFAGDAILVAPFVSVALADWKKRLDALPKDKMARTRTIKEEMQRRHPTLAVTLSTADALALLHSSM